MTDQTGAKELQLRRNDYVAAATKAILGAAPFAGSLLVELAGILIPNQRVDRIVRFAEELDVRLSCLEEGFVRSQLADPAFAEVLEEAMHQAARSITDERRQYLAELVANGLASDDIEHQESRHLLRILGEINDVEIIWLRSYLLPTIGSDKEFREKHADVLDPQHGIPFGPQKDLDKAALQHSYKEHLEALGLIDPQYEMEHELPIPKFDSSTGKQEISYYLVSLLGHLLLRQIGLEKEDDAG